MGGPRLTPVAGDRQFHRAAHRLSRRQQGGGRRELADGDLPAEPDSRAGRHHVHYPDPVHHQPTRTAPLAQPGGNAAATFVPTSVAPGANGACPGGTLFVRPGVTYGPFKTGQDVTLALNRQAVVPTTSDSDIFGLTLNWDVGNVVLKSITSYVGDSGHSNTMGGEEWVIDDARHRPAHDARTSPVSASRCSLPCWRVANGNTGSFDAFNDRHGIEQEFRISSANPASPLSWVAGAYFSHLTTNIHYRYRTDPASGCRAATDVRRHQRTRSGDEREHSALWRW